MNDKINIGEVTLQEYNILMKQLAAGQLGECIELFMKLRMLGEHFAMAQKAQQEAQKSTLPPPAAQE